MTMCMSGSAPTDFYTLSLHDALPIWLWNVCGCQTRAGGPRRENERARFRLVSSKARSPMSPAPGPRRARSEEHTSELQSQSNLVCRLLLEKKKKTKYGKRAG